MGTGKAKHFALGPAAKMAAVAVFALSLAACGGGITEGVSTAALQRAGSAPSTADMAKAGPLEERTLGNPDAPVTIVEYASLGCPLCSAFHDSVFPQLKARYIDTGKVHFIYREFPIGPTPKAAAHAARCVPASQYFEINHKFMANRGRWNARKPDHDLLYKIVQETGVTRAAFDNCMANQKIEDGITRVKQRGRELGVKGTPTFFINGQQVRGYMSFDEMKKHLDRHLKIAAKPA